MVKLSSFTFITLNGFTHGLDGDISWHRHGVEENQYAADSMDSGSTLVFGRSTYELMANYWPTPMAMENDPEVAKGMNASNKLVFTNSLKEVAWENTEIISGNFVDEMKKLKSTSDRDLTILGSGSLLTLFASESLVDDIQIMIDPVAIGSGVSIFSGLEKNLELEFVNCRSFSSGVILLSYKSMK